jgi:hypothetical protein
MQALEFLALVLVNLALTVYLFEKGFKFWKEKRLLKRLVNQHPEMEGVHPDEDGLFVFESDDSLKLLVLQNDQPGVDEPFYVTEEDLEEE